MVKRLASDRAAVPAPEFPLWHGIPRLVPPPFGPPRLPLVAAEPPPPTLTRAPAAVPAQSQPQPQPKWHPATPYPDADYRPPPRYRAPAPEPQRPVPVVRIAALVIVGVLAAAATYVVLQHRVAAPGPVPSPRPRPPVLVRTSPSKVRVSPTPTLNSDTFPAAVSAIASASMIHYVGQQAAPQWDASNWDIYVTADGSLIGTETVDGDQFDVLVVGNGAYFEDPNRQTGWISRSDLANALPSGLDSPNELAAKLANNLPGTEEQTTSLDGTPAIAVATRAGELYFTSAEPQTLLRIDTVNTSGGSAEMDIEPTSSTERDQVRRELITEAQEVGAGQ